MLPPKLLAENSRAGEQPEQEYSIMYFIFIPRLSFVSTAARHSPLSPSLLFVIVPVTSVESVYVKSGLVAHCLNSHSLPDKREREREMEGEVELEGERREEREKER